MSNYGTNLRNIKNYAGGRGLVSKMTSSSASVRNANVTNSSLLSGSLDSNSSTSSSIAALKAELNTYSKIAMDSAENLKTNGNKLVATGEESIFGNAETSGNTTVIVNKAVDFINDFNKISSLIIIFITYKVFNYWF